MLVFLMFCYSSLEDSSFGKNKRIKAVAGGCFSTTGCWIDELVRTTREGRSERREEREGERAVGSLFKAECIYESYSEAQ